MVSSSLPTKNSDDKPYRRVKIALLISFAIVGGILVHFTKNYIDKLEHIAAQSPERALTQATLLFVPLSVVGGIPLVGMGAYCLYVGHRAAQTRGIIMMILGGFVIVCGISLPVVFIWLMRTILNV